MQTPAHSDWGALHPVCLQGFMTGLSERCLWLTLPLCLLGLADEFFAGAGERPVLCPLLLDLLGLLRSHGCCSLAFSIASAIL